MGSVDQLSKKDAQKIEHKELLLKVKTLDQCQHQLESQFENQYLKLQITMLLKAKETLLIKQKQQDLSLRKQKQLFWQFQ